MLLDNACVAFVQGLRLAAGASAVIAITAMVMALILLHNIPASAETMHAPAPDAAPPPEREMREAEWAA